MSSTTINNPEPSANALSHQKVSRLTSTALFAALICVTTAYIFHIPFGVNGGYVHIGDSLIYLAAAFLPTPYAMFAGAIGGGLASILGLAGTGSGITIIPGTMLYAGNGQLPLYLLMVAVSFALGFALTYMFGYEDEKEVATEVETER